MLENVLYVFFKCTRSKTAMSHNSRSRCEIGNIQEHPLCGLHPDTDVAVSVGYSKTGTWNIVCVLWFLWESIGWVVCVCGSSPVVTLLLKNNNNDDYNVRSTITHICHYKGTSDQCSLKLIELLFLLYDFNMI